MALWTMFVEAGELRYITQATASNPRGAVRKLLGSGAVKRVLGREYPDMWPASYSMKDVLQLLPIGGRNMYFCSLAKKGSDASIVVVTIVRTVSRKYA